MSSHQLPPDLGGFNLWEWAGAIFGTIVSLIYTKPRSRRELVTRAAVSLGAGGTFGFVVSMVLNWPDTVRHAFAAGAGLAFFSYAAIEVVYRVLKGVDKWPPGKG
jgi:hypothetical protein